MGRQTQSSGYNSNTSCSELHIWLLNVWLDHNFTGIFKTLGRRSLTQASAPKLFRVQSQYKGGGGPLNLILTLCPQPLWQLLAIEDGKAGTHQSGRPGPDRRQGQWLEGPRPGRGARSQLSARAVASPIAEGGAHLGTSGLRGSPSGPSSVELVPKPVLGGCGLGCEMDETPGGRGSAAEINRRASPPTGPGGPRNPDLKPLGDTPKKPR